MFRGVLFKAFSVQLCMMWIGGAEAVCLGVASCSCEANPSGLVANCRDQNLDHVPAFVPDSASQIYYELTLDSNAIRTIEGNAFAGVRVRRLVLTNNRLASIAVDAFSGLEKDLSELAIEIDNSMAFPTVALSKLTVMNSLEIVGYGHETLPSGALTALSSLRTLTLTSGGLRYLTPEDFSTQKSQLTFLNLHSNLFQEIPTSAISVLTNLAVLQLDLNRLFTIGSAAFEGASSLAILNLARNPVTGVELDAFSGLESTLRNISLQQCHLSNEHLKAITRLKSLVYLDISDNLFDDIDDILKNMKFLQVLKASRNRITSLKRSTYSLMANSLMVLHLDDNPLVDVASDTFSDLTLLQELYLDGAQRLVLDEHSFASQESSLKLLSMRSANLSSSPWSAVSVLGALKTLWMSSCKLTEVPDYTLSRMSRLENLDLNNNAISRLTQRSLAGLSTSLVRLYLSGNKLRTLDECVFYEFKKLDILQLQLNNNPLECDCALKWLHDLLRPYKSNPATHFRVMSLQWKCADLNGKLFTTLTDADFSNCPSGNQSTQCQHLEYTTPSTSSSSTPKQSTKLVLILTDVTHDSILVTWTAPPSAVAIEFNLVYVIDDRTTRVPSLPSDTNHHSLTGLTPNSHYIVCLEMVTSSFPITTCANTTTAGGPESNISAIIIGTSLAGGFVLVCVTIVIVVVVFFRKRQQSKPPQLVRAPTVGRQSKRFRKTKDEYDTTLTTTLTTDSCEDPGEALVHTLVAMTDEEKDRLVNLLTSSMGGLDELDRSSSYRYVGARYGPIDAVNPYCSSVRDRHEYDEIPDSYYDEIKCEDEEVAGVETEGEPTLVGETVDISRHSH